MQQESSKYPFTDKQVKEHFFHLQAVRVLHSLQFILSVPLSLYHLVADATGKGLCPIVQFIDRDAIGYLFNSNSIQAVCLCFCFLCT